MSTTTELPQPNPALRRLGRLVGRWSMEGNLVGSDEKNIRGETTFRWLPRGFFLELRTRRPTGLDPSTLTRTRRPVKRSLAVAPPGAWQRLAHGVQPPGIGSPIRRPKRSSSSGTLSSLK
jgi:hypothetical protein